jgi:hypothetical protein
MQFLLKLADDRLTLGFARFDAAARKTVGARGDDRLGTTDHQKPLLAPNDRDRPPPLTGGRSLGHLAAWPASIWWVGVECHVVAFVCGFENRPNPSQGRQDRYNRTA